MGTKMNQRALSKVGNFFHVSGPYDIETSPLICRAYQWPGFYMIGTSVMKELITVFSTTVE